MAKADMIKFESLKDGQWVRHVYPRTFSREQTTGPLRLRVGMSSGSSEILALLLSLLPEPLFVLYVLHTPRGGGKAGRYQSPELTRAEVEAFLLSFGTFLAGDARHDLWVHSRASGSTLVWDRHDILYAYGPIDSFAHALEAAGFTPNGLSIPSPHSHQYHPAFDPQEAALLAAYDWHWTDLRPDDEQ